MPLLKISRSNRLSTHYTMGFGCSCLNPSVTNLNSGLNKAASFLNPHFGTKPSNMTSYLPNILSKSWGKNLVYKRDTYI